MMAPAWNIVEYRGRDGLLRLEADWRRLYAAMPDRTSYHAFEAHLAQVDHLMGAPDKLRLLALSDCKEVRAICPLVPSSDRTLWIRLDTWQSPELRHMRSADVICADDEARRELTAAVVAHLRREGRGRRLLVLGPLATDSALWDGLRSLGRGRYCTNAVEGEHLLDCSKSFDELTSMLSKKLRGELRRRRRRLDALQGVRFVQAREEADLAAEFETFLDVEASGWKGEKGAGTAIRLHRGWLQYYRTFLSLRGDEDHCEIDALYAEGKCIASQLCVRTGGEFACLKIGYDESYARLAPGLLLRQHMVERCCADPGVKRMNWLSESDWHRAWSPETVHLGYAYVGLDPWAGRLVVALLRLRFGPARRLVRWARRARERLRQRADHRLTDVIGSLQCMIARVRPDRGKLDLRLDS